MQYAFSPFLCEVALLDTTLKHYFYKSVFLFLLLPIQFSSVQFILFCSI